MSERPSEGNINPSESEPTLPASPEKEGAEVSLRDFLTYQNPNLEGYQRLIKAVDKEGMAYGTEYAEGWGMMFFDGWRKDDPQWDRMRAYLKEKLRGGILIDVGGHGGGAVMKSIPRLARLCGVQTLIDVDLKNYAGVWDPYSAKNAEWLTRVDVTEANPSRAFDAKLVAADMLDFISRLPNDQCNFTINGIDGSLLGETPECKEYATALFNEMIRATKPGGVIFGMGTFVWYKDFKFSNGFLDYEKKLKRIGGELGLDKWAIAAQCFEKLPQST